MDSLTALESSGALSPAICDTAESQGPERRSRSAPPMLPGRDTLTGLQTRISFLGHCSSALFEAARRRRPASMFYIELDRFQQINDVLGGTVGAMMFKEVVSLVNTVRNSRDVLGRIRPEALALFICGRTGPETLAMAAKLQRLVGLVTVGSSLAFRRVTVSIGIANSATSSCALLDLQQQADEALEFARTKGRGQVVYSGIA